MYLEQCLSPGKNTDNLYCNNFLCLLKILFICFRQREREGEREGEKHQRVVASHAPPTGHLTWPTTQACALTGN